MTSRATFTSVVPDDHSVEGAVFVVGRVPHAHWDTDLDGKNRAFLAGIDPGYFEHIAHVHAPLVDSVDRDIRQRSAMVIRQTYSQALETFFALLCAAIQSPSFPLGWMLRYGPGDLKDIVGALHRGEPVHCALNTALSWSALAATLLSFSLDDRAKEQAIKDHFAQLWSRFASDFTDDGQSREYNSIKHGLRARAGGFHLSVLLESSPGVAPPREAMSAPSGSKYGSTYLADHRLTSKQRNYSLSKHSRNWVPENLISGIYLLATSISNVLSFLRSAAGEPAESLPYKWPSDLSAFHEPWARKLAFATFDEHPTATEADVQPWTSEEVLSAFPLCSPKPAQ